MRFGDPGEMLQNVDRDIRCEVQGDGAFGERRGPTSVDVLVDESWAGYAPVGRPNTRGKSAERLVEGGVPVWEYVATSVWRRWAGSRH